ncbi:hypothetical protein [Streptomyces cahuitamycinicus]|uniref:Uncharacterized protein n=1 Tax=Streptomyces cahuitamycinicus TaxID=2070367 RepID=A0A2N8TAX5_9ACTN|nr:hypothetical protein [Streptomyces cahuitamycinicus]PNG16189.1 hypothetical protein C1J00_43380 [Streptomyces cahuitamycinicus]
MASTTSIKAYEDNAGGVYLTRGEGETVWFCGPVTADREGQFADDAKAWHEGDWEPGEENGQSPVADVSDLAHIATWTPEGGVQIERKPVGDVVAGAGGQAYLGIDED